MARVPSAIYSSSSTSTVRKFFNAFSVSVSWNAWHIEFSPDSHARHTPSRTRLRKQDPPSVKTRQPAQPRLHWVLEIRTMLHMPTYAAASSGARSENKPKVEEPNLDHANRLTESDEDAIVRVSPGAHLVG